MAARPIIRRRVAFGDRDFAELVVWQVPEPVPPTSHGFKYRLAYIVQGRRVVAFDNERGKGDHKHLDGQEYAYEFTGIDALVTDFLQAVAQWRAQHGKA